MLRIKTYEKFKSGVDIYHVPVNLLGSVIQDYDSDRNELIHKQINLEERESILKYITTPYKIIEKGYTKTLAVLFTTPKIYVTHNYYPAHVYYIIRIAQYPDEWFLFQWFNAIFASQEHLEYYYKKYPHFAPGGNRHTFIGKDNIERLQYQPPIYKDDMDTIPHNASGEYGGHYLCDQKDSLIHIIEEFMGFLKTKDDNFRPDYPEIPRNFFNYTSPY